MFVALDFAFDKISTQGSIACCPGAFGRVTRFSSADEVWLNAKNAQNNEKLEHLQFQDN